MRRLFRRDCNPIRSLTKLYGIAGLRLGYAVAQPQRLQRWAEWRDPWPVNGIALAVGEQLLASPQRYHRWCKRVQRWVSTEGAWMQHQLAALPGITPMPFTGQGSRHSAQRCNRWGCATA